MAPPYIAIPLRPIEFIRSYYHYISHVHFLEMRSRFADDWTLFTRFRFDTPRPTPLPPSPSLSSFIFHATFNYERLSRCQRCGVQGKGRGEREKKKKKKRKEKEFLIRCLVLYHDYVAWTSVHRPRTVSDKIIKHVRRRFKGQFSCFHRTESLNYDSLG